MHKYITNINSATWIRLLAACIAIYSSKHLVSAVINWGKVKGWESYIVAQSLAKGEGYSFPSNKRWLYDYVVDGNYHPTAWVDPLYSYLLGGLIWFFGENHQIAAAILNVALFLLIFFAFYLLIEKMLTPKWALFGVCLLAFSDFSSLPSRMNNTLLASLLIIVSALALISYLKDSNASRASILGLSLGITVLACPSAQFFIPITIVCIIFWQKKKIRSATLHSVLVASLAALIMSPWVIRNYMVFDEFIPTRNGAGQITFIGVIGTGGAVDPESVRSDVKPFWSANSAREAVFKIQQQGTYRDQLEEIFQPDYAKELAPEDWSLMNEAQRDKWFLSETKKYLFSNPLLTAKLGLAKLELFSIIMGSFGLGILIIAFFGAVSNLRSAELSTLALWVASYIGPFILVISYFPRYRAPIEPLLIFFAVLAGYWLFSKTSFAKQRAAT